MFWSVCMQLTLRPVIFLSSALVRSHSLKHFLWHYDSGTNRTFMKLTFIITTSVPEQTHTYTKLQSWVCRHDSYITTNDASKLKALYLQPCFSVHQRISWHHHPTHSLVHNWFATSSKPARRQPPGTGAILRTRHILLHSCYFAGEATQVFH